MTALKIALNVTVGVRSLSVMRSRPGRFSNGPEGGPAPMLIALTSLCGPNDPKSTQLGLGQMINDTGTDDDTLVRHFMSGLRVVCLSSLRLASVFTV